MSKPDTVTSIHGNRYRIGRQLGRGGQGVVFAVEGERMAVKLLRDRSPRARERLRDQLAMVGRLPLEGLAVARPIEQLRPPHVGYVMELFTGMAPLGSLLRPPKGTKGIAEWYFEGGGLRRRLRLLARVAEVVAELHGRGLVYVDLSPHNVFVSERPNACEVRLIDTDNLRTATAAGRPLYTPGYGAPEVVRGTGVQNTLGDAHAFAVLAFETLALVHPLLGDAVRDGEPELEEQALAGRLPWIDAACDDRNRSSDGIPREIVLSRILREDVSRAFGPGLSDPDERPGLAQWGEHLHRAADRDLSRMRRQLLPQSQRLSLVRRSTARVPVRRGLSVGPGKIACGRWGRSRRPAGDRERAGRQETSGRCRGHFRQPDRRAARAHHPRHVSTDREAAGRVRGRSDHPRSARR